MVRRRVQGWDTLGTPLVMALARLREFDPLPQAWPTANQLTELAAAEDEGADAYALACLLGLHGLRVSEACSADVADLGGWHYQPTLLIVGKCDKPAEVVRPRVITGRRPDSGRTREPSLCQPGVSQRLADDIH